MEYPENYSRIRLNQPTHGEKISAATVPAKQFINSFVPSSTSEEQVTLDKHLLEIGIFKTMPVGRVYQLKYIPSPLSHAVVPTLSLSILCYCAWQSKSRSQRSF